MPCREPTSPDVARVACPFPLLSADCRGPWLSPRGVFPGNRHEVEYDWSPFLRLRVDSRSAGGGAPPPPPKTVKTPPGGGAPPPPPRPLLLIAGVAALFLLFVNWLDSWVPGIVWLPIRFWLGLT